jgi:hypothetical protein
MHIAGTANASFASRSTPCAPEGEGECQLSSDCDGVKSAVCDDLHQGCTGIVGSLVRRHYLQPYFIMCAMISGCRHGPIPQPACHACCQVLAAALTLTATGRPCHSPAASHGGIVGVGMRADLHVKAYIACIPDDLLALGQLTSSGGWKSPCLPWYTRPKEPAPSSTPIRMPCSGAP